MLLHETNCFKWCLIKECFVVYTNELEKKIVFNIEFVQHSTITIFSQSNKNKIKMYYYLSTTQTSQ